MSKKRQPRSGRMINGKISVIEPLSELKKSKIPTPVTSDATLGLIERVGGEFIISCFGNVRSKDRKGVKRTPGLSQWLRFNPTPRHKPNAKPGDIVKPLAHERINPSWCTWLMGFPQGWLD